MLFSQLFAFHERPSITQGGGSLQPHFSRYIGAIFPRRTDTGSKKHSCLTLRLVVIMVFGLVVSSTAAAQQVKDTPIVRFERLYDKLLKKYWRPPVSIHGIRTTVFDYAALPKDANRPDSLFKQINHSLESIDPSGLDVSDQTKAFWINVYNFGAMRLIVEHYPVDSIRSMKISIFRHPWSQPVIRVGSKSYSLSEIEKSILLESYHDPRIVFTVSCAAVSCPEQMPEAFTGERLDEQIDEKIRHFFSNPDKGLALDRERRNLTLSWILKKEAHLFKEEQGGVLGFVLPYLDPETRRWLKANPVKVDYFDHDWTLNDLAQAD